MTSNESDSVTKRSVPEAPSLDLLDRELTAETGGASPLSRFAPRRSQTSRWDRKPPWRILVVLCTLTFATGCLDLVSGWFGLFSRTMPVQEARERMRSDPDAEVRRNASVVVKAHIDGCVREISEAAASESDQLTRDTLEGVLEGARKEISYQLDLLRQSRRDSPDQKDRPQSPR